MRLLTFLVFILLALPTSAATLEKGDLVIKTAGGQSYHFNVEIAKTPEQQERGLMFRTAMPADAGMIFPQARDRTMSFWMKNTFIPLDIIFIAADGRIAHIAPEAVPKSETIIPSGGPIRAVLELNGGITARLGIRTGDNVTFPGLGG